MPTPSVPHIMPWQKRANTDLSPAQDTPSSPKKSMLWVDEVASHGSRPTYQTFFMSKHQTMKFGGTWSSIIDFNRMSAARSRF